MILVTGQSFTGQLILLQHLALNLSMFFIELSLGVVEAETNVLITLTNKC